MGLIEGKVALITGGASGIGRATALHFAREGAKVAVADRHLAGAKAVAAEIGTGALAIEVDVARRASVVAMCDATFGRFGRLDCAVNCAGISLPQTPFAELSDENWDMAISINLTGLRLCMGEEIARMRPPGGAIVNISSGAGLKGTGGLGPYVASKHGVVGITKVAAIDYAKANIRVNAVCPGLTRTPMTAESVAKGTYTAEKLCPMARIGEAEEIAEAALWLCSDRSSFVTGVALPVDGGYAAW